jgi:hypothetical protein
VLVVASILSPRVDGGWISGTEIKNMFEQLRIPAPSNVSRDLAVLKADGYVLKGRAGQGWSLTPEGREAVRELIEGLDLSAVEAEIAEVGGAEFDQTRQPVIPPQLAPAKWAIPIGSLLERYPFETNVFLMTRFPKETKEDELPDPVQQVIETARSVLAKHGLHLHLASDRQAEDELFGNVAAHMWVCKYGIGLFETRYSKEFNDNLQIEVGAMLMTGRRTALLKDEGTEQTMPTDLIGQIYKSVDFEDLDAISETLNAWIGCDLGIGDS